MRKPQVGNFGEVHIENDIHTTNDAPLKAYLTQVFAPEESEVW